MPPAPLTNTHTHFYEGAQESLVTLICQWNKQQGGSCFLTCKVTSGPVCLAKRCLVNRAAVQSEQMDQFQSRADTKRILSFPPN